MKKSLFSLLSVSLLTLLSLSQSWFLVWVQSFKVDYKSISWLPKKVSKTLDKTFDKDVREIPTSQFYQEFVDEMGRDLLRKFNPPGTDNWEWGL